MRHKKKYISKTYSLGKVFGKGYRIQKENEENVTIQGKSSEEENLNQNSSISDVHDYFDCFFLLLVKTPVFIFVLSKFRYLEYMRND